MFNKGTHVTANKNYYFTAVFFSAVNVIIHHLKYSEKEKYL